MRTFVIVSPGLSAGRQGRHVTAAELRMSDDKLDAFVQAGHAIEVFDERDRPRRPAPVDTPLDDLADTSLDDLADKPKRKRRGDG